MPTHFDASIKGLHISEAIAYETTAAAFVASASAKEIQIFNEAGSAVPSDKGKFFILSKRADGTVQNSGLINGANIVSVTQTSAITNVPEYSYFTVSNSGVATNDVISLFMKISGVGTMSEADYKTKTISAIVRSTDDTALKIADRLALQAFRNLSEDWYYNNRPQVIHNKAGYDKVYATQAACVTDKASLTNSRLIWIIADGKAYTVSDKTQSTFATICAEKTNWASELSGGTAVYVNAPKYYDIVITSGSVFYVIAKPIDRLIDKFAGEMARTEIGCWTQDPAIIESINSFTVTRVGEAWNPTAGKRIANLEAHLAKKNFQYGFYNYQEFKWTPTAVDTTDYYTITIKYKEDDPTRLLTGNQQETVLMLAFDASADSDTIYALINIAKDGAALTLDDLADVTITNMTDDQVLLADTGVWVNGAVPS